MPLLSQRTARLGTENAFRIAPYIAEAEASGLRVIRCNLGQPDFPVPGHIREELKRQIDGGQGGYCDPQGILPLRNAIARQMRERGIEAAPERVVVFPGVKPSIGLVQLAYTDPGDEVIYPSPGFPIYESFIDYVSAEPVPLFLREENGFTVSAEELDRLITRFTRLVFLNFPSNPTGGVATREQLESLAAVLQARLPEDARIFSDEIYEDIVFDGRRHQSIATLPGMAGRTIVVSGVSKSYAWPGGRVGWALFPTVEEAQVFRNLNINYFSCVSSWAQEGARIALESPLSKPVVQRMVQAFQERRDVVVKGLNAIDGIRCSLPGGAFYAWPNVAGVCERLGVFDAHRSLPAAERERTSPSTLLQMFILLRHGVATLDRRSFGRIGAEREQFLRLSVATGLDDLREAVQRIGAAAHDARGFQEFMRDTQERRPW
jgi:aspartate aminotransferase